MTVFHEATSHVANPFASQSPYHTHPSQGADEQHTPWGAVPAPPSLVSLHGVAVCPYGSTDILKGFYYCPSFSPP